VQVKGGIVVQLLNAAICTAGCLLLALVSISGKEPSQCFIVSVAACKQRLLWAAFQNVQHVPNQTADIAAENLRSWHAPLKQRTCMLIY
jgi:hypothetical protein